MAKPDPHINCRPGECPCYPALTPEEGDTLIAVYEQMTSDSLTDRHYVDNHGPITEEYWEPCRYCPPMPSDDGSGHEGRATEPAYSVRIWADGDEIILPFVIIEGKDYALGDNLVTVAGRISRDIAAEPGDRATVCIYPVADTSCACDYAGVSIASTYYLY